MRDLFGHNYTGALRFPHECYGRCVKICQEQPGLQINRVPSWDVTLIMARHVDEYGTVGEPVTVLYCCFNKRF